MQGRYGTDAFARFTINVSLILIVTAAFLRRSGLGAILDFAGLALMVYTYFRIFSKNISKRYAENQKYLRIRGNIKKRWRREKNILNQRKTYHIYRCPGCSQKIRIPRGKGKIEISCPKCQTKFRKRS